jgi:acetyltransferase-like isoleucine patch superfamily enzyme
MRRTLYRANRVRLRVLMIRWRVRGLRAAPSAVIDSRVRLVNPRGMHLDRHAEIGYASCVKCVPGSFHMGEFSAIGENCWVSSTQSVRIERDVMIGPGCHITDANHGLDGDELIRNQPRAASPVTIGEGAWLGAGAKVLAGVRVGKGSVVGAGAVVTKDVPDYMIVGGVPARIIGSRDEATRPQEEALAG